MHIDQGTWRATSLVAADILALRILIKKGLTHYLHCIVVFLFVHIVLNVVLAALYYRYYYSNTNVYPVMYWSLTAVLLCTLLYMVDCFWKIGLAKYEGFHRLCLIVVAASMAVLLGFVSYMVSESPGMTVPSNWLNLWFGLLSRAVYFLVSALLLLFFAFFWVLRLRVNRTVRNLAVTLFVYSLARAWFQAWSFAKNGLIAQYFVWATTGLTVAMVLSWTWIVSRHQKDKAEVLAPNVSTEILELRAQAASRKLIRLLG